MFANPKGYKMRSGRRQNISDGKVVFRVYEGLHVQGLGIKRRLPDSEVHVTSNTPTRNLHYFVGVLTQGIF